MRKGMLGLACVALVALAGCTAAVTGTTADTAGGLGSERIKVGLAYDRAGRGDKSFNDGAAAGLDRAKEDMEIEATEATIKEETDEARAETLRGLAQAGHNPVIAVGFLYATAVKNVASEFPETTFAIIDDASVEADNVVSLLFAEEQGSYLVGAAAAMASKTGHVGFIGGVRVDLILKFEAGFVAGARSVNPGIKIDVDYLTEPPDFAGFNSPDKGRTTAQRQLAGGADVIYAAAGGSGGGSLEAVAAVPGAKFVGVDSDQYASAPAAVRERILTSMLKRVDNAVFQEVQAFIKGDRSGGVKRYDLKVDGVGYAQSNAKAIKPYTARLERIRYRLINEEVTVPTKP